MENRQEYCKGHGVHLAPTKKPPACAGGRCLLVSYVDFLAVFSGYRTDAGGEDFP